MKDKKAIVFGDIGNHRIAVLTQPGDTAVAPSRNTVRKGLLFVNNHSLRP